MVLQTQWVCICAHGESGRDHHITQMVDSPSPTDCSFVAYDIQPRCSPECAVQQLVGEWLTLRECVGEQAL